MPRICFLANPIQEYAWGSRYAIADLLGQPAPSAVPQAELWMGAHPKAPSIVLHPHASPSVVLHPDASPNLLDWIRMHPEEILHPAVAAAFDGQLPFLFKVLAAAQPLSIQAHPNREQARLGFWREETLNIPRHAPERNYRDPNHKPELLCAMTPFWALCGFRPIDEILQLLDLFHTPNLDHEFEAFRKHPERDDLKTLFTALMTLPLKRQRKLVDEALQFIPPERAHEPIFVWMHRLHAAYPNDIGVLSPILLNLLHLQPGEAIFLQDGQLHAYLEGVGVEIMANSDNVLRGGLTPKHIDVPELLNTLTFLDGPVEILHPCPHPRHPIEQIYPTFANEFRLSVITLASNAIYRSDPVHSVEILLCTDGSATIFDHTYHTEYAIHRGDCVLVPADIPHYSLSGHATLYKASVPLERIHHASTNAHRPA